MGMPIIESSNVEYSQAITDLIQSVALEQAALSHILNAEGEKLQLLIEMAGGESPTITPETLIEVNDSVSEMVSSVSSLESHLQAKLALFAQTARINFYFMKKINGTNDPLEGAVFELLQNGAQAATATSDSNGVVFFRNILPGVYTLGEVSAPSGYTRDTRTYEVIASGELNVLIETVPAAEFTVYNNRNAS